MRVHPLPQGRIMRESAIVILIGISAGFINNALSPRSIPLVGEWNKAYGVPSAGGAHAPTHGNIEIGYEKAASLLREGALFADARPYAEYAKRRIPSAVSMPEESFDEAAPAALEADREGRPVVVYCKGTECDEAHLIASRLREMGVGKVYVFAGGMDEWEKERAPLEGPPGRPK